MARTPLLIAMLAFSLFIDSPVEANAPAEDVLRRAMNEIEALLEGRTEGGLESLVATSRDLCRVVDGTESRCMDKYELQRLDGLPARVRGLLAKQYDAARLRLPGVLEAENDLEETDRQALSRVVDALRSVRIYLEPPSPQDPGFERAQQFQEQVLRALRILVSDEDLNRLRDKLTPRVRGALGLVEESLRGAPDALPRLLQRLRDDLVPELDRELGRTLCDLMANAVQAESEVFGELLALLNDNQCGVSALEDWLDDAERRRTAIHQLAKVFGASSGDAPDWSSLARHLEGKREKLRGGLAHEVFPAFVVSDLDDEGIRKQLKGLEGNVICRLPTLGLCGPGLGEATTVADLKTSFAEVQRFAKLGSSIALGGRLELQWRPTVVSAEGGEVLGFRLWLVEQTPTIPRSFPAALQWFSGPLTASSARPVPRPLDLSVPRSDGEQTVKLPNSARDSLLQALWPEIPKGWVTEINVDRTRLRIVFGDSCFEFPPKPTNETACPPVEEGFFERRADLVSDLAERHAKRALEQFRDRLRKRLEASEVYQWIAAEKAHVRHHGHSFVVGFPLDREGAPFGKGDEVRVCIGEDSFEPRVALHVDGARFLRQLDSLSWLRIKPRPVPASSDDPCAGIDATSYHLKLAFPGVVWPQGDEIEIGELRIDEAMGPTIRWLPIGGTTIALAGGVGTLEIASRSFPQGPGAGPRLTLSLFVGAEALRFDVLPRVHEGGVVAELSGLAAFSRLNELLKPLGLGPIEALRVLGTRIWVLGPPPSEWAALDELLVEGAFDQLRDTVTDPIFRALCEDADGTVRTDCMSGSLIVDLSLPSAGLESCLASISAEGVVFSGCNWRPLSQAGSQVLREVLEVRLLDKDGLPTQSLLGAHSAHLTLPTASPVAVILEVRRGPSLGLQVRIEGFDVEGRRFEDLAAALAHSAAKRLEPFVEQLRDELKRFGVEVSKLREGRVELRFRSEDFEIVVSNVGFVMPSSLGSSNFKLDFSQARVSHDLDKALARLIPGMEVPEIQVSTTLDGVVLGASVKLSVLGHEVGQLSTEIRLASDGVKWSGVELRGQALRGLFEKEMNRILQDRQIELNGWKLTLEEIELKRDGWKLKANLEILGMRIKGAFSFIGGKLSVEWNQREVMGDLIRKVLGALGVQDTLEIFVKDLTGFSGCRLELKPVDDIPEKIAIEGCQLTIKDVVQVVVPRVEATRDGRFRLAGGRAIEVRVLAPVTLPTPIPVVLKDAGVRVEPKMLTVSGTFVPLESKLEPFMKLVGTAVVSWKGDHIEVRSRTQLVILGLGSLGEDEDVVTVQSNRVTYSRSLQLKGRLSRIFSGALQVRAEAETGQSWQGRMEVTGKARILGEDLLEVSGEFDLKSLSLSARAEADLKLLGKGTVAFESGRYFRNPEVTGSVDLDLLGYKVAGVAFRVGLDGNSRASVRFLKLLRFTVTAPSYREIPEAAARRLKELLKLRIDPDSIFKAVISVLRGRFDLNPFSGFGTGGDGSGGSKDERNGGDGVEGGPRGTGVQGTHEDLLNHGSVSEHPTDGETNRELSSNNAEHSEPTDPLTPDSTVGHTDERPGLMATGNIRYSITSGVDGSVVLKGGVGGGDMAEVMRLPRDVQSVRQFDDTAGRSVGRALMLDLERKHFAHILNAQNGLVYIFAKPAESDVAAASFFRLSGVRGVHLDPPDAESLAGLAPEAPTADLWRRALSRIARATALNGPSDEFAHAQVESIILLRSTSRHALFLRFRGEDDDWGYLSGRDKVVGVRGSHIASSMSAGELEDCLSKVADETYLLVMRQDKTCVGLDHTRTVGPRDHEEAERRLEETRMREVRFGPDGSLPTLEPGEDLSLGLSRQPDGQLYLTITSFGQPGDQSSLRYTIDSTDFEYDATTPRGGQLIDSFVMQRLGQVVVTSWVEAGEECWLARLDQENDRWSARVSEEDCKNSPDLRRRNQLSSIARSLPDICRKDECFVELHDERHPVLKWRGDPPPLPHDAILFVTTDTHVFPVEVNAGALGRDLDWPKLTAPTNARNEGGLATLNLLLAFDHAFLIATELHGKDRPYLSADLNGERRFPTYKPLQIERQSVSSVLARVSLPPTGTPTAWFADGTWLYVDTQDAGAFRRVAYRMDGGQTAASPTEWSGLVASDSRHADFGSFSSSDAQRNDKNTLAIHYWHGFGQSASLHWALVRLEMGDKPTLVIQDVSQGDKPPSLQFDYSGDTSTSTIQNLAIHGESFLREMLTVASPLMRNSAQPRGRVKGTQVEDVWEWSAVLKSDSDSGERVDIVVAGPDGAIYSAFGYGLNDELITRLVPWVGSGHLVGELVHLSGNNEQGKGRFLVVSREGRKAVFVGAGRNVKVNLWSLNDERLIEGDMDWAAGFEEPRQLLESIESFIDEGQRPVWLRLTRFSLTGLNCGTANGEALIRWLRGSDITFFLSGGCALRARQSERESLTATSHEEFLCLLGSVSKECRAGGLSSERTVVRWKKGWLLGKEELRVLHEGQWRRLTLRVEGEGDEESAAKLLWNETRSPVCDYEDGATLWAKDQVAFLDCKEERSVQVNTESWMGTVHFVDPPSYGARSEGVPGLKGADIGKAVTTVSLAYSLGTWVALGRDSKGLLKKVWRWTDGGSKPELVIDVKSDGATPPKAEMSRVVRVARAVPKGTKLDKVEFKGDELTIGSTEGKVKVFDLDEKSYVVPEWPQAWLQDKFCRDMRNTEDAKAVAVYLSSEIRMPACLLSCNQPDSRPVLSWSEATEGGRVGLVDGVKLAREIEGEASGVRSLVCEANGRWQAFWEEVPSAKTIRVSEKGDFAVMEPDGKKVAAWVSGIGSRLIVAEESCENIYRSWDCDPGTENDSRWKMLSMQRTCEDRSLLRRLFSADDSCKKMMREKNP